MHNIHSWIYPRKSRYKYYTLQCSSFPVRTHKYNMNRDKRSFLHSFIQKQIVNTTFRNVSETTLVILKVSITMSCEH